VTPGRTFATPSYDRGMNSGTSRSSPPESPYPPGSDRAPRVRARGPPASA
jgi:hypothetical protein